MICNLELTKYWITLPWSHAVIWVGVTARSIEDAIRIVEVFGYLVFVQEDLECIELIEGFSSAEQVERPSWGGVGPVSVRGIWYPFWELGVPKWAQERIDNHQPSKIYSELVKKCHAVSRRF